MDTATKSILEMIVRLSTRVSLLEKAIEVMSEDLYKGKSKE
jgi:hypothetical protein